MIFTSPQISVFSLCFQNQHFIETSRWFLLASARAASKTCFHPTRSIITTQIPYVRKMVQVLPLWDSKYIILSYAFYSYFTLFVFQTYLSSHFHCNKFHLFLKGIIVMFFISTFNYSSVCQTIIREPYIVLHFCFYNLLKF